MDGYVTRLEAGLDEGDRPSDVLRDQILCDGIDHRPENGHPYILSYRDALMEGFQNPEGSAKKCFR
jgi:hypothetical protein